MELADNAHMLLEDEGEEVEMSPEVRAGGFDAVGC